MKLSVFTLFVLAMIFTSSTALHHRVQVYVKTSDGDVGDFVEMRTRVQFFIAGQGSVVQTQSKNGLPESTDFTNGNGELIFDKIFTKDPVSILFTVTEDDGPSTDDDGVCKFLAQPSSWPEGLARFQCFREATNGLKREWWVVMEVISFPPVK